MTELWSYMLTAGKGGRYLFRQCEASDAHRTIYPKMGVEMVRCGADAMRGVTWDGRVEGRHSMLVCDQHTLRYAAPSIEAADQL